MPDTPEPRMEPADDLEATLPPDAEGQEDVVPSFDTPLPPAAIPVAVPVTDAPEGEIPLALPVAEPVAELPPVAEPVRAPTDEELEKTLVVEPEPPAPPQPAPAAGPRLCPLCQAPRVPSLPYCGDCGLFFTEDDSAPAASTAPPPSRLKDRYEIETLISQRRGVSRYRGRDTGHPAVASRPVVILEQKLPTPVQVVTVDPVEPEVNGDEVLPSFDLPDPGSVTATALPMSDWPSVTWERELLTNLDLPGLPEILDSFVEGDREYLILEVPTGRVLWDAWDDPESSQRMRFGWLKQVAELMRTLHRSGAMLEGIRPEVIVITDDGKARLADLTDLLPLPVPADAPLQGRLYSAPELLSEPASADARADLYSFGAMLYALHVGRELSDVDFDRPGHPKPFLPRFPDAHPAFGRLMTKTFRREVHSRFPTDEAGREDATGFGELIHYLDVCARTLDAVRLEIAAWTTTGIVRTGNEDAFALLHSCESRQDDINDAALVFLCDGMGGYEAGEVAAALAIQTLREQLLAQPAFKPLAGATSFRSKLPGHGDDNAAVTIDTEACKQALRAALKETNRQVHQAGRTMPGKRNMGCTAEAVYVDGRQVVVGHVGDSRTYHLHEGELIQMTRDHTLVNRLVELGTLTAAEAETHPRRNELQMAIGGQPEVEPGLYAGEMKPGDWVVVCSDGVTNHVTPIMLKQMLLGEATSAEMAARRLVNLVNIEGATDNATVVVIRAT